MSALSRLALAASYFHEEAFELWDRATDTWRPGFDGRIYVFDRFKTIYHRPTRRETLGIVRTVSLPTDLVIRHVATGTVYMVSNTDRTDVDHVNIYDRARALHRSDTQGDLIRYAIQGTGDDLGPLVANDLGKVYYDTELRTETAEQSSYAVQQGDMIGRYFVTTPTSIEILEGDYIQTPNSDYLRVDLVYEDSGFHVLRAVVMTPNHETMVYELRTGEGGGYDPSTGQVTPAIRADREFSGYIGSLEHLNQDVQTDIKHDLEVWIDTAHIGFTPVPGDFIRARGLRYHVDKVTLSHSGIKYQLLCRRAAQTHNFSIPVTELSLNGLIPGLS